MSRRYLPMMVCVLVDQFGAAAEIAASADHRSPQIPSLELRPPALNWQSQRVAHRFLSWRLIGTFPGSFNHFQIPSTIAFSIAHRHHLGTSVRLYRGMFEPF